LKYSKYFEKNNLRQIAFPAEIQGYLASLSILIWQMWTVCVVRRQMQSISIFSFALFHLSQLFKMLVAFKRKLCIAVPSYSVLYDLQL